MFKKFILRFLEIEKIPVFYRDENLIKEFILYKIFFHDHLLLNWWEEKGR